MRRAEPLVLQWRMESRPCVTHLTPNSRQVSAHSRMVLYFGPILCNLNAEVAVLRGTVQVRKEAKMVDVHSIEVPEEDGPLRIGNLESVKNDTVARSHVLLNPRLHIHTV